MIMRNQVRIGSLALMVLAAVPAEAQSDTPAQSAFEGVTSLGDEVLGKTTGREDIAMMSDSTQVSSVNNSSVNGTSQTGELSVSGNAFQNVSGLVVINANTGNNVSFNASMQVNIALTPGN